MAYSGQSGGAQRQQNYSDRSSSSSYQRREEMDIEIPDSDFKQIIQGNELGATQMLVTTAEKIGQELEERGLKSSQIRTIFGTVRQIEMSWTLDSSDPVKQSAAMRKATTQLVLLKPKMAYQAVRNKPVKPLATILSRGIDLVGDNRENFQRFVDFFEAILAYHKAAGGED